MLQAGRGLLAGCVVGAGGRLLLTPTALPTGLGSLVAGLSWSPQRWGPAENQKPQLEFQEVQELLSTATSDGTLNSAYEGLHKLSEWVSTNKVDFTKDVKSKEQFGKLINMIDQGTIRTPPISLLGALKSLTRMGVRGDTHVVQSIQNELLWNIRKVSFPILLSILIFHVKLQNTKLEKKVLQEAVEAVQRRWVEVCRPSEMELLYLHHDLFTAEFLSRLDDRTIELADDMSSTELAKVFCALGSVHRRATPVIRSLAFHLSRQGDNLPPKILSNILFSALALSFPDPVLLEKVASDLTPQVSQIDKPSVVSGVLFTAGQMRWRCPPLLEALSSWVENNVASCSPRTLAALVITLATVSYTPANADTLFSVVVPRLSLDVSRQSSVWLDVVWALVVVGRANNEQVASVLDSGFVAAMCAAEHHHRPGVRLKLLTVDAAAGLLLEGYTGPRLDQEEVVGPAMPVRGREELGLARHVVNTLHNLVPPPKYIIENVSSPMGVHVDAELMVDRQGRPLPIAEYGSSLVGSRQTSSIPEGAVSLGVLVWSFRDYTVGTQELVGSARLALRLLEAQGCRALQVPYFEYSTKTKTLKNVQYLEAKIKEVVGTR